MTIINKLSESEYNSFYEVGYHDYLIKYKQRKKDYERGLVQNLIKHPSDIDDEKLREEGKKIVRINKSLIVKEEKQEQHVH